MALAVVAVFIDLQEAHIAAGALRAAGFRAEVFDSQYGTVDWVVQAALGGFRLAVPQAQAGEALGFLRHIHDTAPEREPAAPGHVAGGYVRAAAAAGLFTVFGGLFGRLADDLAWLLARRRPLRLDHLAGMVLTTILLILAAGAAYVALLALTNLILDPP